jgi:hypothetical protein
MTAAGGRLALPNVLECHDDEEERRIEGVEVEQHLQREQGEGWWGGHGVTRRDMRCA